MHIAPVIAAAASLAVTAPAPTLFAPGEISGPVDVDSVAFSPDGRTVFFDQTIGGVSTIVGARQRHGHWGPAQVAGFSGVWSDKDPAMSPDGRFLVFGSNRPAAPGGPPLDLIRPDGSVVAGQGNQLWRVDRTAAGWGAPWRLPEAINSSGRIHSPSVVADGSLYFQRPDPQTRTFHLFRSQWRHGAYEPPTPVVIGPAAADERDPAVSADESFMVFSANYGPKGAPNRLYIVFRDGGGGWGAPIDLGDAVNHDGAEGPHLGPDGHTVYFDSSARTPVRLPRTRAQAAADLARARAWDNGTSHLWALDLTPWLTAHGKAGR
jgi:hypothetical protein